MSRPHYSRLETDDNDSTLRCSGNFKPVLENTSLAEERQNLAQMRRLALEIDQQSMLAPNVRAVEFAFAYVSADRAKRQKNIQRSKAKHKARLAAAQKKVE